MFHKSVSVFVFLILFRKYFSVKLLSVKFVSVFCSVKCVEYFFSNFSSNKPKRSRYLPTQEENSIALFNEYKDKVSKTSDREISQNFSSRSAKLRYATRSKTEFYIPDELSKKFKIYLDLEAIDV